MIIIGNKPVILKYENNNKQKTKIKKLVDISLKKVLKISLIKNLAKYKTY